MLAARPSTLLRAVFARLQEEGLRVVATSPARAAGRMQDDVPRLVVMDLTACATPELVAKAHELAVPIAVLGTTMRSRSTFVARALGARHVMTPTPSVDSVAGSIIDCLQAEQQKRSTLDQPLRTTLSELQEAISQEIRVGLSRVGNLPREGDAELVINSPQTIATYVRRLRAAIARNASEAQPAPCQLTEQPRLLTARRAEYVPTESLSGSRLVLVDGNVARSDAVTSVLRRAGADVFVCSAEELLGELSRIAELDPSALIVEDLLASMARRLLDEVGAESRLKWCKVVELPLSELWSAGERSIDADQLLSLVEPATGDERRLARRLADESSLTIRLEEMGPARLLHAIASAGVAARLSHFESACLTRVDFAADGLIAGAKVRLPNRETLEGPLALATFLRRKSGEVRLERLSDATIVNLLAPVCNCVILASEETPPNLEGAELDSNLARLTWSTSPGAQVGNITWSNIPALTPEALRQYSITDAGELLDAAEDSDEDEDEKPLEASNRVASELPPRPGDSGPPPAMETIPPPAKTPAIGLAPSLGTRKTKKSKGKARKAKTPLGKAPKPNPANARQTTSRPSAPFPLGLALAVLLVLAILTAWIF